MLCAKEAAIRSKNSLNSFGFFPTVLFFFMYRFNNFPAGPFLKLQLYFCTYRLWYGITVPFFAFEWRARAGLSVSSGSSAGRFLFASMDSGLLPPRSSLVWRDGPGRDPSVVEVPLNG